MSIPRFAKSSKTVEVLTAVTPSGVNETGAGMVGNMVAGKHRHSELIAAAEALERVRKRNSFKLLPCHAANAVDRQLGFQSDSSASASAKINF